MKVLFINSLEPNQGDLYFFGLKRLLGDKNVTEYPYKPLYHCKIKDGKIIAEINGKTVVEEIVNTGTVRYTVWRKSRFKRKYRKIEYKIPKIYCSSYKVQETNDLLNYDLVIVSFLRNSTPLVIENMIFSKKLSLPVVLIDGEDDFYIRKAYVTPQVVKYLKREILTKIFTNRLSFYGLFNYSNYKRLLTESFLGSLTYPSLSKPIAIAYGNFFKKMKPLNLTTSDYGFTPDYNRKDYDLSFIMGTSNSLRSFLYKHLLRISKKYRLKSFIHLSSSGQEVIPWNMYINIVARSKISISLPGAGFDTYRFWEIPYHGAALMSLEPYIKITNNFSDGENAIYFRSVQELEEKLTYYLKSDRWEQIAKNGREHFMKYHTPVRRAQQIISILEWIS